MCEKARRRVTSIAALLIAAGAAAEPSESRGEPQSHQVWLVSERWHASIVLAQRDVLAAGSLPEAADLQRSRFLAFGWGDRDYYMAEEPDFGTTLRAALVGTPAVLHVEGWAASPIQHGDGRQVIREALDAQAFQALLSALSDTFSRGQDLRAKPIAQGLSRRSYFYPAEGSFHLLNTCNTWAARMLQAAGLGVSPEGVVRPNHLMSQF